MQINKHNLIYWRREQNEYTEHYVFCLLKQKHKMKYVKIVNIYLLRKKTRMEILNREKGEVNKNWS